MKIKNYAVCGVSTRAIEMYIAPMLRKFGHCARLTGLLDIDPLRFKVCKEAVPEAADVAEYPADAFDRMIAEQRPDALIVTGMDSTHVEYILRGLANDIDIICEKPMTTNIADGRRVLEAEKRSRGTVYCTFNYRYSPISRRIREMILDGKVGRVTHIDLNWYIDIKHGSSYFHRWNRMRENSGSLSIHKSSHHFDLVNWWIDGTPAQVHAFGALNHYGPDGEFNPARRPKRFCGECTEREQCAYKRRWETRNSVIFAKDDHINAFESGKKLFTDYRPDQCMFDDEIDIHDTYIANIRYRSGALLNYSANFSTPYEGYRLAINGTRGRLETLQFGGAAGRMLPQPFADSQFIDYYPIFGSRERISVISSEGGHGGGDPLLQEDLYLGEDPLRRYDILARSLDGFKAISIGDAVYRSITDGTVQTLQFD